MKRNALIIGAGRGGSALLTHLIHISAVNLVAIIDQDQHAPGFSVAKQHKISIGCNWQEYLDDSIDLIFDATGSKQLMQKVLKTMSNQTHFIPSSVASIIVEILEDNQRLASKWRAQKQQQDLMLDTIDEGMVVIDNEERISFLNRRAQEILSSNKKSIIGHPIEEVIHPLGLPQVLQSRKKEINREVQLENEKRIISTRVPIIDAVNNLHGALAIFRDITEVVALAEKVTGLREVKKMLEAIFHSSDEAISVVDKSGKGIMINPAYTRVTGLTEKEVVGMPASVDIVDGKSMHMQVLKTRRPVRGVRMKVGPNKKDVIVNVAPIIVDGVLKGSVGILHDVTEMEQLTEDLQRARQIIRSLEVKYTFDDIIGVSDEIKLALEQAKVGARTPASVLLRGESGTGKELFAHAIHHESNRRHHKFIRVNCAAITESILESELFGYEEGAFSGANRGGKKGYFEEADKGSIFLDEIGELSLSTQAKLLRVLQEKEIVRVGGTKSIPVDVRIITATHVNLEKAIMEGQFREDLYYRLNRLPIFIPSLRERMQDFELLANYLLAKLNLDYGRNIKGLNKEAIYYLKAYHWPGNVRELENVISRAMIYMKIHEELITKEHLPSLDPHQSEGQESNKLVSYKCSNQSLHDALEKFEKQVIINALSSNQYNKAQTAKALQISVRNLYYKIEKHQIN